MSGQHGVSACDGHYGSKVRVRAGLVHVFET